MRPIPPAPDGVRRLLRPATRREPLGAPAIATLVVRSRREVEGSPNDSRTDEAPRNLLTNPSFEVGGTDGPSGWSTGSFVPNDASFVWPSAAVSNGNVSAALESLSGNDLWWSQTVALVEGEHYRLCGALKGEAIQGVQGDVGANISVLGGFIRSDAISGSFDWTTRCVDFVADAPQAEVACRLGFYGSTARGKLWCDALTLEHAHMRSAF